MRKGVLHSHTNYQLPTIHNCVKAIELKFCSKECIVQTMVKFSDWYLIATPSYDSLKLCKLICVEDPFSQIRSQLCTQAQLKAGIRLWNQRWQPRCYGLQDFSYYNLQTLNCLWPFLSRHLWFHNFFTQAIKGCTIFL